MLTLFHSPPWYALLAVLLLSYSHAHAQPETALGSPFRVVQPRTSAPQDPKLNRGHPINLSVFNEKLRGRDRVELAMDGRLSVDQPAAFAQQLRISPLEREEPITIAVALPFNFPKWISTERPVRLEYTAESTVLGHSKDLRIAQDGRLIRSIQRYGNGPVELNIESIKLQQAAAKTSAAKPHADYYYAVPVVVTDAQGRSTRLWQGDVVQIVAADGEHMLQVYVLVSDVAKPIGMMAALHEGAPFQLQVVIARTDR